MSTHEIQDNNIPNEDIHKELSIQENQQDEDHDDDLSFGSFMSQSSSVTATSVVVSNTAIQGNSHDVEPLCKSSDPMREEEDLTRDEKGNVFPDNPNMPNLVTETEAGASVCDEKMTSIVPLAVDITLETNVTGVNTDTDTPTIMKDCDSSHDAPCMQSDDASSLPRELTVESKDEQQGLHGDDGINKSDNDNDAVAMEVDVHQKIKSDLENVDHHLCENIPSEESIHGGTAGVSSLMLEEKSHTHDKESDIDRNHGEMGEYSNKLLVENDESTAQHLLVTKDNGGGFFKDGLDTFNGQHMEADRDIGDMCFDGDENGVDGHKTLFDNENNGLVLKKVTYEFDIHDAVVENEKDYEIMNENNDGSDGQDIKVDVVEMNDYFVTPLGEDRQANDEFREISTKDDDSCDDHDNIHDSPTDVVQDDGHPGDDHGSEGFGDDDGDDDDFGDFAEMPLSEQDEKIKIDKEVIPESGFTTATETTFVNDREKDGSDGQENMADAVEMDGLVDLAKVSEDKQMNDQFQEISTKDDDSCDDHDNIHDSPTDVVQDDGNPGDDYGSEGFGDGDGDDDDFGDFAEMPLSEQDEKIKIDKEVIPESGFTDREEEQDDDGDDEFGDFGDFEGSDQPQVSDFHNDKDSCEKDVEIDDTALSYGPIQTSQEQSSPDDVASAEEQNNYSNFVKRTISIFHNIFFSNDIAINKRSSPLTVDLGASSHILNALSELPHEEDSSVSVQKLRTSHLEPLFDYTTKEDNPSNVVIDDMFQFRFPQDFDMQFGVSTSCYFSFGKASNDQTAFSEPSDNSENESNIPKDSPAVEAQSEGLHGVTVFSDEPEVKEAMGAYASPTVVKIPQKKAKSSIRGNDVAQMKNISQDDGISSSNDDVVSGIQFNDASDTTHPHAHISSETATGRDIDDGRDDFGGNEFGQFHEHPVVSSPVPDDPFGNEVLSAIPLAVVDQSKEQLHSDNNMYGHEVGANFKTEEEYMFRATDSDFQAFSNDLHVPGNELGDIVQPDVPFSDTIGRHNDDGECEFEDDEFGKFHEPPAEISPEPDDPFGSEDLSAIPLAVIDQAKQQLNYDNEKNGDETVENFKADGEAAAADSQAFRNLHDNVPGIQCQNPDAVQSGAPISSEETSSRNSNGDDEIEDDEFGQFHEPPADISLGSKDPFGSEILSAIPLSAVDQAEDELHRERNGNESTSKSKTDGGHMFPTLTGNFNLHDSVNGVQLNGIYYDTLQPHDTISAEAPITTDSVDDDMKDDEFGQFHEPPVEICPEPDHSVRSEILSMTPLAVADQAKEQLHGPCDPTDNARDMGLAFEMDGSNTANILSDNYHGGTSEFIPVDPDYNQANGYAKVDMQMISIHQHEQDNQCQVSNNVETNRLHSQTVINDPANINMDDNYVEESLARSGSFEMQPERPMNQLNDVDFAQHENGATLLSGMHFYATPTSAKIPQEKTQSSTVNTTMRSNDMAQNLYHDDGISTSVHSVASGVQLNGIYCGTLQPHAPFSSESPNDIDNADDDSEDDEFGQFHEPPAEIGPETNNPLGCEVLSMKPLAVTDQAKEQLHQYRARYGDETGTSYKTSNDSSCVTTTLENVYFGSYDNTVSTAATELAFGVVGSSATQNLGDNAKTIDADQNINLGQQRRISTFTNNGLTQIRTSVNEYASDVFVDGTMTQTAGVGISPTQVKGKYSSKRSQEFQLSCTQDCSLNEENNFEGDANHQGSDVDFGEFEAPPEDKSNSKFDDFERPETEESPNKFMALAESNVRNSMGYNLPNMPISVQDADVTTFQVDKVLHKPSLISQLFSPIGEEEIHFPPSSILSFDQYPNSSKEQNKGALGEQFNFSVESDDIPRDQNKLSTISTDNAGNICYEHNNLKHEDDSVPTLDGPAISLQEQNNASSNLSRCDSDDDSFGEFCVPTQGDVDSSRMPPLDLP